jgi:hypothetical protein
MWKEQKSDRLPSLDCSQNVLHPPPPPPGGSRKAVCYRRLHEPRFCSSYIMTSYSVSITEQTTAKSYLFVSNSMVYRAIYNCHCRLILKLGKEMQINQHSYKEHTKISKIANCLVAKCCKVRKIYSPAKFANFVYFRIACGNSYHIWADSKVVY